MTPTPPVPDEIPTDRHGVEVLSLSRCWELLRESEVGRLAVTVGEQPEIFPLNFVVDHGTVLFRTAEGAKLAAVADGRPVAFEVDGYDASSGDAWSVVVKGQGTVVSDTHERFDAGDLPLFPWHAAPKPRFVRIVPGEVSGRRFRVVDRPSADPPRRASPE